MQAPTKVGDDNWLPTPSLGKKRRHPMHIRITVVTIILGIWLGAVSAQAGGSSPLFRDGVLAGFSDGDGLTYSSQRIGHAGPGQVESGGEGPVTDARIELVMVPDDEVTLSVVEGKTSRHAGTFPRSVGNPLIMYFLEAVLRDMVNQAGGSPAYIRNRIKAALLQGADVEPVTISFGGRTVSASEITIYPFKADAARDRMFGFADLALTALVSDEVPGWYYSLAATAPAAEGQPRPGYSNLITLSTEGTK